MLSGILRKIQRYVESVTKKEFNEVIAKSNLFVGNYMKLTRGGDTPYNGLYRETPPERGTFFRLQVYERVGISQV